MDVCVETTPGRASVMVRQLRSRTDRRALKSKSRPLQQGLFKQFLFRRPRLLFQGWGHGLQTQLATRSASGLERHGCVSDHVDWIGDRQTALLNTTDLRTQMHVRDVFDIDWPLVCRELAGKISTAMGRSVLATISSKPSRIRLTSSRSLNLRDWPPQQSGCFERSVRD
jgi:hypothetical protein